MALMTVMMTQTLCHRATMSSQYGHHARVQPTLLFPLSKKKLVEHFTSLFNLTSFKSFVNYLISKLKRKKIV